MQSGECMKFKPGDLVYYGETGVCRVEDIAVKAMPNGDVECYKLAPVYQSCAIFTPIQNECVNIRSIISADDAERLIGLIPSLKPEVCTLVNPRALTERYTAVLKSGESDKLLELICSIYIKRTDCIEKKKKLSAVDERFLKKAEDLLFGELAAALGTDRHHIYDRVDALL